MCGILIAFIILAAIISALLHVSAGWGIGVAVGVLVIAGFLQNKYGTTKRVSKTGVMFTNVCPACRKHNKSKATVCRFCGSPLVVAKQVPTAAPPPATTSPETAATKTCPDCAETVLAAARKCRFCGYVFPDVGAGAVSPDQP